MAIDDSFTKLLLHMEGTDGEAVFTDEAGNSVSATGTAQTKTAQKKFGDTSGFFNTGYLNIPSSDDFDFGTGDFTIDAWVYQTSSVNYAVILSSGQSSWGDGCTAFILDGTNGKVRLVRNYQNSTLYAADGPAFANNQWMHIAAVRKDDYVTIFVNGIAGTPVKFNNLSLAYNGGGNTRIGGGNWDGSNGMFHGYIDELRVSKGIARWTTNFQPPAKPYDPANKTIDVLVVGGGGGGGNGASSQYEGGGGGGGGFIYQTALPAEETSINIVVGPGGAANANGSPSSFGSLSAAGGGCGKGSKAAAVGGSGGGNFNGTGASGTLGLGNAGGSGTGSSSGGGGGAGEAGHAGNAGTLPAQGGAGLACSITGTAVKYAAGGGGIAGPTAGAGGDGGGGAGNMTGAGYPGTNGTGSGGGGGKSSGNYAGGAGGSGIVIVRYKTSDFSQSTGGTITTDGDYTVHTFTSNGTLVLADAHIHVLAGTAIFGPFLLPDFIDDPAESVISMDATIPVGTSATIYAAITEGEPTGQDFIEVGNGNPIPGLTQESAGKNFHIKLALGTTDALLTPTVRSISFSITETLNKRRIWLMLTADGRIKNPEGNIRVQYSKATGTLVGPNNGQVENFDISFAPTLPIPIFNPHDIEHVSAAISVSSALVQIYYESYGTDNAYVDANISVASSIIHVNDIPA